MTTHLGFPWALPECPEEVQERLFEEMLDYIKTREEAKKYAILMNTAIERYLKSHSGRAFAKKHF